jgi:hypothetical protein
MPKHRGSGLRREKTIYNAGKMIDEGSSLAVMKKYNAGLIMEHVLRGR